MKDDHIYSLFPPPNFPHKAPAKDSLWNFIFLKFANP